MIHNLIKEKSANQTKIKGVRKNYVTRENIDFFIHRNETFPTSIWIWLILQHPNKCDEKKNNSKETWLGNGETNSGKLKDLKWKTGFPMTKIAETKSTGKFVCIREKSTATTKWKKYRKSAEKKTVDIHKAECVLLSVWLSHCESVCATTSFKDICAFRSCTRTI